MEYIKEAFIKVKQDIDFLKQEIINLQGSLFEARQNLAKLQKKLESQNQKDSGTTPTPTPKNLTDRTDYPTHNPPLEQVKPQNLPFSIRNEGVPTDKQTNRQTDKPPQISSKTPKNPIDHVTEILNSLDNIKKEIRLKFKQLTDQELLVFSTLYQLEEEKGYVDYKILAQKLGLTESSIRDYIGRLIKKGIPVDKRKINNKNVHLFVSQNLKKIASLQSILYLREL